MDKLYQQKLIYIPTDLVGNNVADQIRKAYNLETSPQIDAALAKINSIIFGDGSKVEVKWKETKGKVKIYDVHINGFNVKDLEKALDDATAGLTGGALLAVKLIQSLALAGLIVDAADKLIAQPIFYKDLFFDVSFDAGTILDKTFIPATNVVDQTYNQSQIVPTHYYKIRSVFNKYVKEDPFGRFSNGQNTFSDLIPSLYKMVEANFYDMAFGIPIRNELGKGMNYSLSEKEKKNYIVFYDLETYNTFLQGCQDINSKRLKSVAELKSKSLLLYEKQAEKFKQLKNLNDAVALYSTVEFTTQDNQKNGFSFSQFMNSPQIRPFFQQFLGLYADITVNPTKYQNTVPKWLDKSEEFSIFDRGTGELQGKFNTKVIKAAELVKDSSFLNFQFAKGNEEVECSNIQKKLSSLLFDKKVNEFITNTLEDDETQWKNSNYSETVCYRITKTDKLSGKVSHWFVPNFPSLQDITIFDTNLRFNRGQDAKYEIFELKAVVAVDYEYKSNKPVDPQSFLDEENNPSSKEFAKESLIIPYNPDTKQGPFIDFTVEARPSVNFIEVPYFSQDGILVYDSAPAKPSLQFFGFQGVDNRIKVLFSGYNDQYRAYEQNILAEDADKNAKAELYARQYYAFDTDEIYYKSEMEDADVFELFVLDTKPRKYEDFAQAQRIEIKNTADPIEIKTLVQNNKPYGSSYSIPMEPNKDYWVIARVRDFNGNISNPTEMYQLKIINDDGYINPLIKLFDPNKVGLPEEAQISPSFERLVYAAVPLVHAEPFLNDAGKVEVGTGETSPFSKTYKVRIKSKKTNKKFDINVYFTKTISELESKEKLPPGYDYNEYNIKTTLLED